MLSAEKKPREELERPIHIISYNWLRSNIDGMVYHVPNGLHTGNEVVFIRGRPVRRAAIAWKKLQEMGARSGVLDLTIHWNPGKTAYFEIKSADGRLSENQKEFIVDLDACGIPHYVIRSLAECQAAVRHAGIPLKNFFPYTPGADSGNA